MRMTSSDFSLRLCAFSVLRARIWNATSGSGIRIAGHPLGLQLLERRAAMVAVRRPVDARASARPPRSGPRSGRACLTTSVSRLAWVGERSRWYGVGATVVERQQAEGLPVPAHRLAVDGEHAAAVRGPPARGAPRPLSGGSSSSGCWPQGLMGCSVLRGTVAASRAMSAPAQARGTTIDTVMVPRLLRALTACATLASLGAPALERREPGAVEPLDLDRGATGLGLALRRVGTTARVLYVTAHPDDEHNGILVRLSRGLGLRTALLTVTRGEGGQNAIGPELFDALGVLRTGELLALHRYDGVEQYFGRAYEFGYSFSVEETFEKWGREETLGDIVRVVRAFRPDVIVTLPLQGTGGGQHHQAVALSSRRKRSGPRPTPRASRSRAFRRGRRASSTRAASAASAGAEDAAVRVPTGVYDPLLGMTWQQLGMRARAHAPLPGHGPARRRPGARRGPLPAGRRRARRSTRSRGRHPGRCRHDARRPAALRARRRGARGGARGPRGAMLDAARAAFDPASPEAAVPALASALTGARALRAELAALVARRPRTRRDRRAPRGRGGRRRGRPRPRSRPRPGGPRRRRARDARSDAARRGGALQPRPTRARWSRRSSSTAPAGWTRRAARRRRGRAALAGGALAPRPLRSSRVARDARPSQPYWRRLPDRDRHELLVAADETLPWSPPPVVARARLRVAGVRDDAARAGRLALRGRVRRRREAARAHGGAGAVGAAHARGRGDSARGDRGGPWRSGPRCAASRRPRPRPRCGSRRLRASRWSRHRVALAFAVEGEEAVARFRVTPPSSLRAGTLRLARGGDARRPRLPRRRPGDRLRPRRAPSAAAPGRDARARARRAHGPGRLGGLRDGLGRRARRCDPAARACR